MKNTMNFRRRRISVNYFEPYVVLESVGEVSEEKVVEDILESEPSTNQAWLMLTSCGHTPTRVSVAEKPNFSWVGRVLRVAPCYSFKCLKVIIILIDQS